jgi:hypothetical protein
MFFQDCSVLNLLPRTTVSWVTPDCSLAATRIRLRRVSLPWAARIHEESAGGLVPAERLSESEDTEHDAVRRPQLGDRGGVRGSPCRNDVCVAQIGVAEGVAVDRCRGHCPRRVRPRQRRRGARDAGHGGSALSTRPRKGFRYNLDGTATRASGYPSRRSSGGRYRPRIDRGPARRVLPRVRADRGDHGRAGHDHRKVLRRGRGTAGREVRRGSLRLAPASPERLVAGTSRRPSRAQHDHLLVTRRDGV